VVNLFITASGLRQALLLPSAWVLIVANLSMLAGVLVWHWSVFDIVLLYWVENLVIGIINVFRMLLATGEPRLAATASKRMRQWQAGQSINREGRRVLANNAFKFFLIPFFILHYGMFCYGHGVFVLGMFGIEAVHGRDISPFRFLDLVSPAFGFAIATLALSHTFSFFNNFLLGGEFRRSHAAMLMMRPYGRIVALHITILLGAFLTEFIGSPVGMLVVLVLLKTMADLALHETERRKLGAKSE